MVVQDRENINLTFVEDNINKFKIFALQGGTRSGKTYSSLQLIIKVCTKYSGLTISVCRGSMPILRATALRDFIDIMTQVGLYSEGNHNKSSNEYHLNKNIIEFFGLDEEQKVRGRKRDILFVNEANEISFDKWQQLLFRTSGKIIIDYNPSMNDSWIYDKVLTREDCGLIISTYKDNLFLEKEIVQEIERTQFIDNNTWQIYGLGQRGFSGSLIYNTYQLVDEIPADWKYIYGLDFGFNAPTALIKIAFKEYDFIADEILYRRGMTNSDLISFLKTNIDNKHEIYADCAEPDRIEEIYRAGLNIKPAMKDIVAGIDAVKAMRMFITKSSGNILNELKTYKYKTDKNGNILDDPVEFNDHALDAIRYGIFTHFKKHINKINSISVI